MASGKKAESSSILQNNRAAVTSELLLKQAERPAKEAAQKAETAPAKKAGRPKFRENYVRLCISIPEETRAQLDAARIEESTPGHVVSVTEMIILLAEEDAKRRARRNKKK